ncbi:MAG: type I-E CRISPR-associated protein Cas7/Cse4/CasC [Anaeromyxobacter sp.]
MNRFLQIHTLTSYPASLINRDDAGFAKRVPFGGAVRTRISSQCLKKHWRSFDGEDGLRNLGQPMSVRSRFTFDELIVKPLRQEGLDGASVEAVTRAVMDTVLGKSTKTAKKAAQEGEDAEKGKKASAPPETALQTGQITVLGRPEVDFLRELVRTICKSGAKADKAAEAVKSHLGRDGAKNLAAMRCGAGLDAALFGRMVTSDILAQGDAAVHVAHAFTVHGEATESDYFSAVDELLEIRDDELGSGHIGTSELTTGLFYGYVAIDVPLLVSNLEGRPRAEWQAADRSLAADVVDRLVKMIATVSPAAKVGSTAPYAYAQLVLVESGSAQPRQLCDAFLEPVAARPNLAANAYAALGRHAADMDRMYGRRFDRALAGLGKTEGLCDALKVAAPQSLAEVAAWAAAQVRGA